MRWIDFKLKKRKMRALVSNQEKRREEMMWKKGEGVENERKAETLRQSVTRSLSINRAALVP